MAASLLSEAKPYIEDGVHPQIIIRAFRQAVSIAVSKIREISVKVDKSNPDDLRRVLLKCAATTLSSKMVAGQKQFFAKLVVDAVMMLDVLLPLNMIGMKKVQGGALEVGHRCAVLR